MKSGEERLPRATRAPANPMTRTATTTRPHACRNSRSVKGGVVAVTSGTAVMDLVSRRSVMPSRTHTLTISSPGRSGISSNSSGWDGSGDCAIEPPPAAHDTTFRLPDGRTR